MRRYKSQRDGDIRVVKVYLLRKHLNQLFDSNICRAEEQTTAAPTMEWHPQTPDSLFIQVVHNISRCFLLHIQIGFDTCQVFIVKLRENGIAATKFLICKAQTMDHIKVFSSHMWHFCETQMYIFLLSYSILWPLGDPVFHPNGKYQVAPV